jgi:hypothetical protein
LEANIKKYVRRWQLLGQIGGEHQEVCKKVTVAGAYHRTDHYHKNLSLRPWIKLRKYSLNKSINLLVSVLSLMCGWTKLRKCSLNKSINLAVSVSLMCGWEKREQTLNRKENYLPMFYFRWVSKDLHYFLSFLHMYMPIHTQSLVQC